MGEVLCIFPCFLQSVLRNAVASWNCVHTAVENAVISQMSVHCALKNAVISRVFALSALKNDVVAKSFVQKTQYSLQDVRYALTYAVIFRFLCMMHLNCCHFQIFLRT